MEMGVEDVRRWSEMGVKGVRVRSNPKSNPDWKRQSVKQKWNGSAGEVLLLDG